MGRLLPKAGVRVLRRRVKASPPLLDGVGGAYYRRISAATRRIVWERDGGRCSECGSTVDLQFDHIIPASMGGSGGPDNVELLCRPCNLRKGRRLSVRQV